MVLGLALEKFSKSSRFFPQGCSRPRGCNNTPEDNLKGRSPHRAEKINYVGFSRALCEGPQQGGKPGI